VRSQVKRTKCKGLAVLTVASVAVVMAAWQPAMAKEYFVSNVPAIAAAMSTAQPGDTLTMTPGTWSNAQIVFQGNGAADRPILLRAAPYGAVVINGASYLRIGGDYLAVSGLLFQGGYSPSGAVIEFRSTSGTPSNHCRLTNSGIVDYNPASSTTDYKWVSLYGTDNRVDHCYFKGKNHLGTTLVVWLAEYPNYHRIDHNHFGFRPELGVNGAETIRVGTSDWSLYDSFTTVEYNLFEQCDGEVEIISSKSCGNVYRYNTFTSCKGTLTLRHGNRCRVEGNFFFGNNVSNSGGIRIIGEDHVVVNNYVAGTTGTASRAALSLYEGIPNSPLNGYYQVKRALVAFNTLVDNTSSIDIGAGKTSEVTMPPIDSRISNNVVQSSKGPLVKLTDQLATVTYEGNLFFGAAVGLSPVPAGITVADPLLQPAGADGLRRIAWNSPAVNASAGSFPDIVLDMDGQPRDSLKDAGADEYSAGPVLIRPLKGSDVGPGSEPTSVGHTVPGPGSGMLHLDQNFPNPFNPETLIAFSVPHRGWARLEVHNVLGERVRNLFEGLASQRNLFRFDASNLPTGVYYAVLSYERERRVRPMLYVR
jgi:poly(beta-D-mannuronate) lyase